jgi:hypothetical protein
MLLILPGKTVPPELATAVVTRFTRALGLVVALNVQDFDVSVNVIAAVVQLPIVRIGVEAVSAVIVIVTPD